MENISNTIWDVEYSPDHSYLFAVAGNAMIIFDSQTGELCKSNVGVHQANVYCLAISKDGRLIATGGGDNTVVIWNGINIAAEKKFKMSGCVQSLSFNPTTGLLFIGTNKDVGLFKPSAEKKKLERTKLKNMIVKSADWSPDGRFIAYGTNTGHVYLKDSNFEKKKTIVKLAPVTCLSWSPLTLDHSELLLVIACVDQTLSFHDEDGEQFGFERKCKMEIYSISWFSNGNYFIASGSHNLVCVYSREGALLKELATADDWIWGVSVDSYNNRFSFGTNDGEVRTFNLDFREPRAISEDKFAIRKGLTEVLITDADSDKKGRFRCKELVRHISLFKQLLAVELNTRVLVYEETPQLESTRKGKRVGFAYTNIGKFSKKLKSDFFILASQNFISIKDNKIKSFDFAERLSNEWVMDSKVLFIKLINGPERGESLLVGTMKGKVSRVMLNNPFPTVLINHDIPIISLDLSLMKKYLGVVDSKKGFSLYDINQKKAIENEIKIEFCCFNSEFDEMYAYGGEGLIFVKTLGYSGISMKLKGEMVGFKGSKIKMVNNSTINTVDLPLSSFMSNFISKKNFKMAYKIASLGVPDQDMRNLGMAALKNRQFTIAKKAFTRVKEVGYLDLAMKYERIHDTEAFDETQLVIDILSYEKKFGKAIAYLKKKNNPEKAIELCITMRRWNEAIKLVRQAKKSGALKNSKYDIYKLLKMQAEGESAKGNWKAAVDLLVNCNEYRRAIDILIKHDRQEEVLIQMRRLTKAKEADTLKTCADYFIQKANHQAAKEALLKLGDKHELMKMHVALEKWDEALMLGNSDSDLREIMLLPYAEHLAKSNKFDEAQKYYKEAGRADLSMNIMKRLSNINLVQKNYKQAAEFFWILAKENLKTVRSIKNPKEEDKKMIHNFEEYLLFAELYHAYDLIYEYILRPVNIEKYPGYNKSVLNASKTIIGLGSSLKLQHISLSNVYYVFSKTSILLGGKKAARMAYEKLNSLIVKIEWIEEIELLSLKSRAQPKGTNAANWKCPRCNQQHVTCPENRCSNCLHPIIISPLSFSAIPVVEFEVEGVSTHEEIMENLTNNEHKKNPRASRVSNTRKKKKLWDFNMEEKEAGEGETHDEGEMDVAAEKNINTFEEDTPFYDKVTQATDLQMAQSTYIPVKIDVETLWSMDVDDVFVVSYKHFHSDYPLKYFKKVDPEVDIIMCNECCKFYIAEEFDLWFNQFGCCPYCKNANLSF